MIDDDEDEVTKYHKDNDNVFDEYQAEEVEIEVQGQ